MRTTRRGFAILALGLLGACYGNLRPTPAVLRVEVVPDDARVLLDDVFVARARVTAVRPKEVAPGRHRLTVEAPGYFPHDLDLDLPSGETNVRIELRPIPR
ncbi:MAG: PEGA domain-containing protein [Sandaracinus sp.]|nr:PEGA domain-containing protein [Sandaracinus sp.]